MNREKAEEVQRKLRELVHEKDTELLELLFIETKRELDTRFFLNKIAGGEISARDARLFRE